MSTRAPQPLPVGVMTLIGAVGLLAGGGVAQLLYDAAPTIALLALPLVGVAIYAGVRRILDSDAAGWRRATTVVAVTLAAGAYFVVVAGGSWRPAPPHNTVQLVVGLIGIVLVILGSAAVPIVIVGAAVWHSETWPLPSSGRAALAPLAIRGTLACASLMMTLAGFIAVLVTVPRPYVPDALLALLFGLPLLLHGGWTYSFGRLLARWEADALPHELIGALARLRERCHFRFDRVLCLDAACGDGKLCAVTSTIRTSTLIISEPLATTFSANELLAVLAHEAAHIELRHFARKLRSGALATAAWIGIVVLVELVFSATLGRALVVGRIVVMSVTFSYLWALFQSHVSRKHEREADEYAARAAGPESVITALEKLGAHRHPLRLANRYTNHGTWAVRSSHLRALAALEKPQDHQSAL